MPKPLRETARITEQAAAEAKSTGRMLVQFISPGWGSSGYYSTEVLEQAAADQIIPAGTHMYADHPTDAEARERPVRSIKDLMSVTTEAARLATEDDIERGADLGALVGEVDIVPSYRPLLEHLKDAIGASIRGDGEVTENGEADGRTGRIIESLAHVKSVDWVTRAGRGGKVLSLVESARANTRAISHGISEATVNDIREALQQQLREAYGTAERSYVWVRDFDDTTVWFEVEDGDESGIYGQTYTESDGVVALTGTRTEVRVQTTYVPATRPDSTTTATEESKEDTMGKISIEESEHATLTEKAGRVDALVAENATKDARIREFEEAEATRTRNARALEIIEARATEAGVTFTPREQKGFLADITLTESGDLDEDAFTKVVDEDAATKKANGGGGRILGHGGTSVAESGSIGWGDIDNVLGLTEQKGA